MDGVTVVLMSTYGLNISREGGTKNIIGMEIDVHYFKKARITKVISSHFASDGEGKLNDIAFVVEYELVNNDID